MWTLLRLVLTRVIPWMVLTLPSAISGRDSGAAGKKALHLKDCMCTWRGCSHGVWACLLRSAVWCLPFADGSDFWIAVVVQAIIVVCADHFFPLSGQVAE